MSGYVYVCSVRQTLSEEGNCSIRFDRENSMHLYDTGQSQVLMVLG